MNAAAYDEYAQVAEPPRASDPVLRAVFLCKDEAFHRFLAARPEYIWGTVDEKQARNVLCELCGIKSRAELATNEQAAAKFRALENEFRRSASSAHAA